MKQTHKQRSTDPGSEQDGGHSDAPRISRRTFLHKSLVAGAAVAGGGALNFFETFTTIGVAHAAAESFSFAWVSDTHLYPKTLNTRFVEKATRAFQEVAAMGPKLDFMIFGGDLAQLGDPVEIKLGGELLKEVKIKKYFIPGEHDWYLDMGKTWVDNFGAAPWKFDHKGVRFIGLDTVGNAPDYWSAKKMSPKERMDHMSVLDGSVAGPWSGLGPKQLQWLSSALSDWDKSKPVIVFTHTPMYEYYPPWNFWLRDWREAQEILQQFKNVTNVHGHVHQPLYHEMGNMRFIGQLATSWPWPYAPQGVPALTKAMIRGDPGDPFDAVGWGLASFAGGKVEQQYKMWRKEVFATADVDSGTGDNRNQILSPRIADRMWQY
jgi:3',5'-cyclic AMP phosphodiesterase CpdA